MQEPLLISSKQNDKIKYLRSLSLKGSAKKTSQKHSTLLVGGEQYIKAAIEHNWQIEYFITSEQIPSFVPKNTRLLKLSYELMSYVFNMDNAPSCAATFHIKQPEPIPNNERCLLALYEPRDKGNFGTILRTLRALGLAHIITISNSCYPYSYELVQTSACALFGCQIHAMSEKEFLTFVKNSNYNLIGTDLNTNTSFRNVNYSQPHIILMGSESTGLPQELLSACNILCKINQENTIDSLNLAIASALMLYESFRNL